MGIFSSPVFESFLMNCFVNLNFSSFVANHQMLLFYSVHHAFSQFICSNVFASLLAPHDES